MEFNHRKLLIRKFSRLIYNSIGDSYFSHIVQKCDSVYLILLFFRLSHSSRYHFAVLCNSDRVPFSVFVLCINCFCQSLQHTIIYLLQFIICLIKFIESASCHTHRHCAKYNYYHVEYNTQSHIIYNKIAYFFIKNIIIYYHNRIPLVHNRSREYGYMFFAHFITKCLVLF